ANSDMAGPSRLPRLVLTASLTQNPLSQSDNRAAFFRQTDESVRHDEAEFRVVPADKGFDGDDAPLAKIDLRLIVDAELAFDQPTTNAVDQHPLFICRLVHP